MNKYAYIITGCPEPAAKFGCGNITAGASTLHTTRVYRCRTGSEPANPVTTTCLPGPQGPTWSEPTHICSGKDQLFIHDDTKITCYTEVANT